MSTSTPTTPIPKLPADARVAIAVADWNGHITSRLLEGCVERLKECGLTDEQISVYHVPGAVELTHAAATLARTGRFGAVVVFGCVVRGGTPHFDYVCQSVTQGITMLNAQTVPVIFGVLTVDTEFDALDRCGGAHGHKGREAAEAAIQMIAFDRKVNAPSL